MNEMRFSAQPQLESFLPSVTAQFLVRELGHQILRLALRKGPSDLFNPKLRVTDALTKDSIGPPMPGKCARPLFTSRARTACIGQPMPA